MRKASQRGAAAAAVAAAAVMQSACGANPYGLTVWPRQLSSRKGLNWMAACRENAVEGAQGPRQLAPRVAPVLPARARTTLPRAAHERCTFRTLLARTPLPRPRRAAQGAQRAALRAVPCVLRSPLARPRIRLPRAAAGLSLNPTRALAPAAGALPIAQAARPDDAGGAASSFLSDPLGSDQSSGTGASSPDASADDAATPRDCATAGAAAAAAAAATRRVARKGSSTAGGAGGGGEDEEEMRDQASPAPAPAGEAVLTGRVGGARRAARGAGAAAAAGGAGGDRQRAGAMRGWFGAAETEGRLARRGPVIKAHGCPMPTHPPTHLSPPQLDDNPAGVRIWCDGLTADSRQPWWDEAFALLTLSVRGAPPGLSVRLPSCGCLDGAPPRQQRGQNPQPALFSCAPTAELASPSRVHVRVSRCSCAGPKSAGVLLC